ncbi:hypothetical protein GPECTOR_25g429 [Gonium pectorale]|uniref:Uncharacterized protein n=1 Tax=Gonium pectorale TaxID=33097 RepID=A0A150GGA4_GONPE|nr:hypothetical protein GPECTOR_25g429 [Gonium pectorale]|eukprot:KXZ48844.1 hypothetical protein GPECTOR_25g429 [Gonium pectorale]
MVIFWIIFSFVVLIGRFFGSLPFAYGVMLGSCSHTGFFMLLAGLVLQTHENLAEAFQRNRIWSSSDYQTYIATFSFNYILCGTYLIMFLLLLFTKGPMTAEGGAERGSSYAVKTSANPPTAAAAAPASTGTAAAPAPAEAPYDNHGFGTNWPKAYRGGDV